MNKSLLLRYTAVPISSVLLASCAAFSENPAREYCSANASYKATFESTWSEKTHPTDYPSADAHYSKLVGATHLPDTSFWKVGAKASKAVKDIAEKGINSKFERAVSWAIKIKEAGAYIDGPGLATGTGIVEVDFTVTPKYSNVTLLTMIAPSPDWIVGVSGVDLCVGGQWADKQVHTLYALDGGTDDGQNYAYATAETKTDPQDVIKPVINERLGISKEVPFGSLTFVRTDNQ